MEGDVRQSSNLFHYFDVSLPGNSLREKAPSVQNTLVRVTKKGACFSCNEEGHWARDCPRRTNPSPGSGSPIAGRRSYPEMQCPCGYGACKVFTSLTVKNPNRDFYCCPLKKSEQCGFFKWCDEAASGQIPMLKSPMKPYQEHDGINTLAQSASHLGLKSPMKPGKHGNDTGLPNPICSCGAGKCILAIAHDGEFAGRKYYACPIKKGQGACNHFQWYESTTKACEIEHSDGFLQKPNIPALGYRDVFNPIYVAKAKDAISPVSPLLEDQIFLREPQTSTREKEPRVAHNFIGQGAYNNHFQWYDTTTKASVIENSDWLLDKPNSPTNKEAFIAINIAEEEDMVVPVSPVRPDQSRRDACVQTSPLKRLGLGESSRRDVGSSKHKKIMKFGDDMHWLNEFNASPTYPCVKCGRFGHLKHNCPA